MIRFLSKFFGTCKRLNREKPKFRPEIESLECRELLAVFVWEGGTIDRSWMNGGNWKVGGAIQSMPPGENDDVVLDRTDASNQHPNINADDNPKCRSIKVEDNLAVNLEIVGSLTVNSTINAPDSYWNNWGTISGTGTLSIHTGIKKIEFFQGDFTLSKFYLSGNLVEVKAYSNLLNWNSPDMVIGQNSSGDAKFVDLRFRINMTGPIGTSNTASITFTGQNSDGLKSWMILEDSEYAFSGGGTFHNKARVERTEANNDPLEFGMQLINEHADAKLTLSGGAKVSFSGNPGFKQTNGTTDLSGASTRMSTPTLMVFEGGTLISRSATLESDDVEVKGSTTWKIDGVVGTYTTTTVEADLLVTGNAILVMDGKGDASNSDSISVLWTFTMPATNNVTLSWSTQGAAEQGIIWDLFTASSFNVDMATIFAGGKPAGYTFLIDELTAPGRIRLRKD